MDAIDKLTDADNWALPPQKKNLITKIKSFLYGLTKEGRRLRRREMQEHPFLYNALIKSGIKDKNIVGYTDKSLIVKVRKSNCWKKWEFIYGGLNERPKLRGKKGEGQERND